MSKVFVDSSVLFSACYSSTGASREIIRLGISGKIKLVISKHVLEEVQRNLEKDVPQVIPTLKDFLNIVSFEVVYPTKKAKADYLVSLDTKHLVLPNVAKNADMEIVLPGEFLKRITN